MGSRVILSASSDIGAALGAHWTSRGHSVIGTHRSRNSKRHLSSLKVLPVLCDLSSRRSVRSASKQISRKLLGQGWEVLVLAAGTQNPVGEFSKSSFREWEDSIDVNFIRQMQFLHHLLPYASTGARVLFFAGGGTNSAVERYSAYTTSKIAAIKLFELLAAEEKDLTFITVGPGWVKTKIHSQTLNAGERAGSNLKVAQQKLASEDFFPMSELLQRLDWVLSAEHDAVTGRNFSAVHDPFQEPEFETWLIENSNRFKLRRFGNDARQ